MQSEIQRITEIMKHNDLVSLANKAKLVAAIDSAVADLRSLGYVVQPPPVCGGVIGDSTAAAIKEPTTVSGGGHTVRPPVADHIKARVMPLASGKVGEYDTLPVAHGHGVKPHTDDGTRTLVHLESGKETTGFPDFASIGRYIRGRCAAQTPPRLFDHEYNPQSWLGYA